MLMPSIRRHFEPARSVSDKENVALEHFPPLVLEDRSTKISQPMSVKDCTKIAQSRIQKLAKKSIEDRSCGWYAADCTILYLTTIMMVY